MSTDQKAEHAREMSPRATQLPHVDLVMAHFNNATYAGDAVRSIVGQSHRDWTLHVVDDCSPAESWREQLQVLQHDSRIRLYRTSRNVGHYRIKNSMIRHLDGPLVGFPDSDDISCEERLETQLCSLTSDRADILGCSFKCANASGKIESEKRMVRNVNLALALGRRFVMLLPTAITTLEVVRFLGGFDGTARVAADSDFILRASTHFRLRNLRQAMYIKRRHKSSLTEAEATGFGSPVREAYRASMLLRHSQRRSLRGEQLRQAVLAPSNDEQFEIDIL